MNTQISTTSFDRDKRYSGVYQQQGRMLRDADWNELVDVVKDRLATALQDVVGSGIPATGGLLSAHGPQPGRAFVDGIEAELVIVAPAEGTADPYTDQADFPGAPALPAATGYVLYLDVWERVVSALDDSGLVDPALHGLLESLDADSSYLTPAEYTAYKAHADEGTAQVGLSVSKRYGYATVVSVVPGSPADQPKAAPQGTISTPGVERSPAAASRAVKMMATTAKA